MPKLIDRNSAREMGLKRYFTGSPCKHNHVTYRLVSNTKCVMCQATTHRKTYDETPEALRKMRRREKYLKNAYDIDLVEYQRLATEQNNRCKCCGDLPKHLMVDHDHDTGKVRGLLCVNCNSMLGYAIDNPQRLQLAIEYLEKTK